MSGSMAPDPPVTATSRGFRWRLGLIIAIGLIWTYHATHGMPGPAGEGSGPVTCPECGEPGGDLENRFYVCKNSHVFPAAQANDGNGEREEPE
jgi:hypothetical protein